MQGLNVENVCCHDFKVPAVVSIAVVVYCGRVLV